MDSKYENNKMALYLKSQVVRAYPCTRGKFLSVTGTPPQKNANLEEEGYHIIYPDVGESFCPKESFESTSRKFKFHERELIYNF